MKCRPNCGACCIVPSISSEIPGMPNGKPAGTRCIHLTSENKCVIYISSNKPKVCDEFKADKVVCGDTRKEAIQLLGALEGINVEHLL